jgi:hypothetical protein
VPPLTAPPPLALGRSRTAAARVAEEERGGDAGAPLPLERGTEEERRLPLGGEEEVGIGGGRGRLRLGSAGQSRFSPSPSPAYKVDLNKSVRLSHIAGPAGSWSHTSWTLSEGQHVRNLLTASNGCGEKWDLRFTVVT